MAPDWRAENPYQNLLAQGLREAGCTVDFASYRLEWFGLNKLCRAAPRPQVLHLHWEHPVLAWALWSERGPIRALKAIVLALDVLGLRARGIRVVWTIHNRVSHESEDPSAEIKLRKLLARCASRVIVHSASALAVLRADLGAARLPESKLAVIPHGNYDGQYPPSPQAEAALRMQHGLDESNTTILFFGALRRYKGVSNLLHAFRQVQRPDLRLVIAGGGADSAGLAELQAAAASDPRIKLELRFIPATEVSALFALADAVVVPFERTLTSGSVVLTMTMGRALVLPIAATVLDMPGAKGAIYYGDEAELPGLLTALDKASLHRLGAHNRSMADGLAWSRLAQMTQRIYCDG